MTEKMDLVLGDRYAFGTKGCTYTGEFAGMRSSDGRLSVCIVIANDLTIHIHADTICKIERTLTTVDMFKNMAPGEIATLYRPDQPDEPHRNIIKGENHHLYIIMESDIIAFEAEGWNNWEVVK